MAISKNELPHYLIDWNEVVGYSKYGYVQQVLNQLGWENDMAGKNSRKIHNVYAGILKDRQILDAIRAVLLPKSTVKSPMVDRFKVMTK